MVKWKLEAEDAARRIKISIVVESPDSSIILSLVEDISKHISGKEEEQPVQEEMPNSLENMTQFDKLKLLLYMKLQTGWASATEIMKMYKEEFDEEISLNAVSTYLNRFVKMGILERSGPRKKYLYKLTKKGIEMLKKYEPLVELLQAV